MQAKIKFFSKNCTTKTENFSWKFLTDQLSRMEMLNIIRAYTTSKWKKYFKRKKYIQISKVFQKTEGNVYHFQLRLA